MNRSLIFLFLLISCTILDVSRCAAQVPQAINYQAVVRNLKGELFANKPFSIRLSVILPTTGAEEYAETFSNVTTNTFGLFTVQVGRGKAVNGTFPAIKWGVGQKFIKVEMDTTNGTNYVNLGLSEMISVPYALYAEYAGKYGNPGDTSDKNELNISLTYDTTSKILTVLDAGGKKSTFLNLKADSLGDNSINDLKDVKASPVLKGQVLKYNGKKWVAGNDDTSTYCLWQKGIKKGDIFYNGGNVGIGSSSPTAALNISDNQNYKTKTTSVDFQCYTDTGAKEYYGLQTRLYANKSSKNIPLMTGIQGYSTAKANNNQSVNIGLWGLADNSALFNRGVMGETEGTGYFNQGVLGFAVGSSASSTINSGIWGEANQSLGYNYGVRGDANYKGGNYNVGVLGQADSGATLNVGLFGEAQNGKTYNYAAWLAGNSRIDGNLALNGDLNYTGSLKSVSDGKFKKEITNIKNAIDIIANLHPHSYKYRTDDFAEMNLPSGMQYGFIAQELEKALPELVSSNKYESKKGLNITAKGLFNANSSKDFGLASNNINHPSSTIIIPELITYKSVNYIGLIPILTEAIKEQQSIITCLQTQLEIQKQEMATQKKRLDEIEKRIK